MLHNSDAALAFILKDEGGYAERNTEGGGAVNMGVTFTVFSAWRKARKMPPPTFADLKAMPVEEARDIYRANYAKTIGFDELPAGIDYAVLDAAVNGGPAGALRLLQKALGVAVSGRWNLQTRWAARHRPVHLLIDRICDLRIAHYKTFERFNTPYKPGATRTWGEIWTTRIEKVRSRAKAMIKETANA